MKPKEILRTIESHLELKPNKLPEIIENQEYLKKKDIKAETQIAKIDKEIKSIKITVENKQDIIALAEELTHVIDITSSTQTRITKYEDYFYDNVLIEALGYYGSKIITPNRLPKPVRYRLKEIIKQKNWEKLKWTYTYQQDEKEDNEMWHEIGYDLGERLYQYVQKTCDKKPILDIVMKNRQKEKPFEVYKRILEKVT
ncbi:MAG: hypothetical protein Q8N77_02075 [Nanoarchaeota archaeon]|nr:hypothetical protein [Nanoarchaeota archaeon]